MQSKKQSKRRKMQEMRLQEFKTEKSKEERRKDRKVSLSTFFFILQSILDYYAGVPELGQMGGT